MIATNGSIDHSDISKRPENVARICSQLRDLATEMASLRRQKSSNQDNVMDVDLEYEDLNDSTTTKTNTPVDPEIKKQLGEKSFQGMMLISSLKTLNRQLYHNERALRNDLTDQKLNVGKVDLGIQNIKYQRKYLTNEIARCRDMETIYQEVPLVSLEEFRQTAPKELTTVEAMDDQEEMHQLMLNRLQFELEERKRIDAEKRRLITVKANLTKVNKARTSTLNKIEQQLENYIKLSQPLQDLFQDPVLDPSAPAKAKEQAAAAFAAATNAAATAAASAAAAAAESSKTTEPGEMVSSSSSPAASSLARVSSSDSRRRGGGGGDRPSSSSQDKEDRYMDLS
ncbi:THO complex subunit 5 [Entomortierella parvispora]|uniref:THO complex subunit 5 n=1 Tax=Entomortierella parvispora TaxID=205924 RepID=A0A9P3M144_9FUNG|nr:THO complex subunit 5 [Entomortierella parvispora]